MFVDSWGLEYLVVTGSEYDGFPIFNERYKYNFIEPAIKKIKELKVNYMDYKFKWIFR